MLYKLRNVGVSGIFYNVIKNMYVSSNLSVKMKSGFTQLFPSTIGVRQDDTLSPDVFKVFINDLPKIFDTLCCGVYIGMLHLNRTLFCYQQQKQVCRDVSVSLKSTVMIGALK